MIEHVVVERDGIKYDIDYEVIGDKYKLLYVDIM